MESGDGRSRSCHTPPHMCLLPLRLLSSNVRNVEKLSMLRTVVTLCAPSMNSSIGYHMMVQRNAYVRFKQ